MVEDWKIYKLGDVANVQNGYAFKSKDLGEKGIPVIKIKNIVPPNVVTEGAGFYTFEINSKLEKYILEKNDFLISMTGSTVNVMSSAVGKMGRYRLDEVALLNQRVGKIYITDSEKADFDYLCHFLNRYEVHYNLALNATGSANQANISPAQIKDIDLLLPPIKEQRAIASILSALDDKIELNLQMNKTLEDMAMTLYKHWFVDFGPFQEGEMVDSELGEIPKGWEVKKLGELLNVKHGYAFKGSFFQQGERKELLLTPGNFQVDGGIKFNWGKQKFYSGEVPSDYILKKGDLIIALTDLTQSCDILGAPAFIPDEDYQYLHNQRLGLVTDLKSQLSKELLYCIANTYSFRSYIKNTKSGSTVSHTSPTRIYEYKVAVPSNEVFEYLNKQLSNLNNLKFSNLSENKLLSKTRDTLLPKLISGEVRVKEAEKIITEAL